jgi:polyhydroxyalkanoate synthesis repressor PhaR
MAYVIKRYANRKLYDTQSKRYLTLDEVAILVRAGEEVQVVDADSGADLTGQTCS